jgi:hypothetical protein
MNPTQTEPADQLVRLIISWLLVAVLLGYGIIETLITAVKIFTG